MVRSQRPRRSLLADEVRGKVQLSRSFSSTHRGSKESGEKSVSMSGAKFSPADDVVCWFNESTFCCYIADEANQASISRFAKLAVARVDDLFAGRQV